MGDPIRKPAKTTPAKQVGTSRAARRRPTVDHLFQLIDYAVTRLLALAVIIAIARGRASAELAAVLWAVYHLLKITRRQ
ncbi:MAG TPA: hypothetical protein VG276_16320 [Actinomycetes bacterium]|jgi:hypothetical protein|nr:hypothetical protein [Actinomycetes bacterium]